jgi:anti-sigma factor RsiW
VTVTRGPRGADLTCEQVIGLLADYLESALTPEVIAELQAHLEGCAPCVAYLRTYRRTKDLTAQTERVEMPEEMKTRLRRFLLDKLSSEPGGDR